MNDMPLYTALWQVETKLVSHHVCVTLNKMLEVLEINIALITAVCRT